MGVISLRSILKTPTPKFDFYGIWIFFVSVIQDKEWVCWCGLVYFNIVTPPRGYFFFYYGLRKDFKNQA